MGRSWWMLVASGRRARRRVGDALWAARYPARRGLHSARARLAAWRRGRMEALVPAQIRWQRASGGRRAAVAVLALLASLAAVVGVSLRPSAEGEPPSPPEAGRIADGVLPEAVERGPASEATPSRPRPRKAAPAPAAAGPAGVGANSAANGLASAPAAPSLPAPDEVDSPGGRDGPAGGAPDRAPSPPREFRSDGRPNLGPRARVPFGGGPGTRQPSGAAPRPGAPSGDDGAAPQPAPAPPPPAEVPADPPVSTTPEEPEPDEGGGAGGGNGGGNGPPAGGPPGQGGGVGGGPDRG